MHVWLSSSFFNLLHFSFFFFFFSVCGFFLFFVQIHSIWCSMSHLLQTRFCFSLRELTPTKSKMNFRNYCFFIFDDLWTIIESFVLLTVEESTLNKQYGWCKDKDLWDRNSKKIKQDYMNCLFISKRKKSCFSDYDTRLYSVIKAVILTRFDGMDGRI